MSVRMNVSKSAWEINLNVKNGKSKTPKKQKRNTQKKQLRADYIPWCELKVIKGAAVSSFFFICDQFSFTACLKRTKTYFVDSRKKTHAREYIFESKNSYRIIFFFWNITNEIVMILVRLNLIFPLNFFFVYWLLCVCVFIDRRIAPMKNSTNEMKVIITCEIWQTHALDDSFE